MTAETLVQSLFGNREAILRVASCPQALCIGLLFVLAAGFAREYDGEDLLHEPWHLLIPLAASLASSAVLYFLVRFIAWRRGAVQPALLKGYRIFLMLYWMTAPLALLYALPFERFLSAGDSVRANLWLLALVACWRVMPIARVIAIIYSAQFLAALAIVLLFGDSIVLAALQFMPVPVFAIMGGIRLSEAEVIIQLTSLIVFTLGVLSWPIWLGCAVTVASFRQPPWRFLPDSLPDGPKPTLGLWTVAITSVVALIPALPFTQKEQLLRRQVESAFRVGKIHEALESMSIHKRSDFPPHWEPPPRIAYHERYPDITHIQERIVTMSIAPWVRELYDDKYANWLRGNFYHAGRWREMAPSEFERHLAILEKSADPRLMLEGNEFGLIERMEAAPEPLRSRVMKLLRKAGIPFEHSTDAGQYVQPDRGTD